MIRKIILGSLSGLLVLGLIIDLVTGFTVTGSLLGLVEEEHDEQIWWCPMDAQYKVKKYGICPYCNMELQPFEGVVEEGDPILTLTDRQLQQAGGRSPGSSCRRARCGGSRRLRTGSGS